MNYYFLNPPLSSSLSDRKARASKAIQVYTDRVKSEQTKKDSRWDVWVELHHQMEKVLTVENMLCFQSHPQIAPQITGGSGRHFLKKISDQYGLQQLEKLLRNHTETICGKPADLVCEHETYITVTSMRHLYHIAKLLDYFRSLYHAPVHFIEIGGGFGNLARMVWQNNLCDKYYIIDHPVLHTIQYFFLTDFFDPSEVATVGEQGEFLSGSANSKIFLCSLFDYEWIVKTIPKPYVLASTVALTEIPKEGQDHYMKNLSPDLIYVFGQQKHYCREGGKSVDDSRFDNDRFLLDLGLRFHNLEYNFWGYFFEYIGRKRHSK